MSGMLLCRSRQVKEPYYVEELGLYLYSGEELSYYIYHNATLIGEDFLGERLFRFIGQELGMENLELKLRKWAEQADLAELLLVILQDIHYYDGDELFEFREQMAKMERETPAARMLHKADTLFRRGRLSAACRTYDRLLGSKAPELSNGRFCGRVWYSYGMAFACQYCWQAAADCLSEACKFPEQHGAVQHLYLITKIDPTVTVAPELLSGISPEIAQNLDAELAAEQEKARREGIGKETSDWMEKDNIRRAYGLRELVREWKNDYRISLGGA